MDFNHESDPTLNAFERELVSSVKAMNDRVSQEAERSRALLNEQCRALNTRLAEIEQWKGNVETALLGLRLAELEERQKNIEERLKKSKKRKARSNR